MPFDKQQTEQDAHVWNSLGFKLYSQDIPEFRQLRDESHDPRTLETPADFHGAVARAIECRDTGMLRDVAYEMLDRSQTPKDRIASQYLLAAARRHHRNPHPPSGIIDSRPSEPAAAQPDGPATPARTRQHARHRQPVSGTGSCTGQLRTTRALPTPPRRQPAIPPSTRQGRWSVSTRPPPSCWPMPVRPSRQSRGVLFGRTAST